MAVTRFANPSTASAQTFTLASFEEYLREITSRSSREENRAEEKSAGALCCIMNRYELHLAVSQRARDRVLSAGTVKLNNGAVKNWLYGIGLILQHRCERKMITIASVVSNEFKRKQPNLTKDALPCAKKGLETIVRVIYDLAHSKFDVLERLWLSVFGTFLGGALMWFLRLGKLFLFNLVVKFSRMKTLIQQSMSFFPVATCSRVQFTQFAHWNIVSN